ncbi:unnamed protein product [Effrenium voratum]|nr:unnamed protein product [Effrenium voratum]
MGPLRVEPGSLSLGSCSWDGHLGALALQPYESSAGGLALVATGTSPWAAAEALTLLATPTIPPMARQPLTHLLPDYVVLDVEETRRLGAGGFRAAGFWSHDWQQLPSAWQRCWGAQWQAGDALRSLRAAPMACGQRLSGRNGRVRGIHGRRLVAGVDMQFRRRCQAGRIQRTQEFWEKFYSDSDSAEEFDWYCGYEDFQPFFQEFAQPVLEASRGRSESDSRPRILVAGCGNSRLTCDLYDDLLEQKSTAEIWNVDYAEAAIARAREVAEGRKVHQEVADLRHLPEAFHDSFDVVIDKGAVDALFCAGVDSLALAAVSLRAALQPRGVLLLVSGVAPAEEVLKAFAGWETILDGSPYITEEGEATINLRAHLYVFRKPST